MALPKQVAAREERTNELLAKLAPVPGNTAGEQGTEPTNPGTVSGDPPPPKPEPPREDWKARYLVLQGKYDAEVPRLSSENAKLKAENEELKQQLAARPAPANVNTGPTQDPTGVTQEDLSRFDPDLVDLVKRASQAAAKQQIEPISKVVQETQAERDQRLESERQKKAQAEFMDALAELVDDFEDIDKAPAFHAYLAEIDPATGVPRQQTLTERARAFDVASVARIFMGFKRTAAGSQQRKPPPNPALVEQQVPDMAGGARSVQQPETRIWTRAEVKAFYQDVAKGQIRDPNVIAKTEQEIDRASREGRVR